MYLTRKGVAEMCTKYKKTKVLLLCGGGSTRFPGCKKRKPFRPKGITAAQDPTLAKYAFGKLGPTFLQDEIRLFLESGFDPSDIYMIVTDEEQLAEAKKQVEIFGVPHSNILLQIQYFGYVAIMGIGAHDIQELFTEDIKLFISPSDAHMQNPEGFCQAIEMAYNESERTGASIMLCAKVSDENTITGCGNFLYDRTEKGDSYTMIKFIEKPSLDKARELQRNGNSMVSTGIYLVSAKTLMENYPYDELQQRLDAFLMDGCPDTDLRLSVKEFVEKMKFRAVLMKAGWTDAGTLPDYYGILPKGANHHNAWVGSDIERYECFDSLFTALEEGQCMRAANIRNSAAMMYTQDGRLCIGVMPLACGQLAGIMTKIFRGTPLSEREQRAYEILDGTKMGCRIAPTNLSDKITVVFLGSKGITVTAHRDAATDKLYAYIGAEDGENCCIDEATIVAAMAALRTDS